jgi:chromosome segregation ATPase
MPTPLDTARARLTEIQDRLANGDPDLNGSHLAEARRRVDRLEQLEREMAEAEADAARMEAERARQQADPKAEELKAQMWDAAASLAEVREAFDKYLNALHQAVVAYNAEHRTVAGEVRADTRRLAGFGLELNAWGGSLTVDGKVFTATHIRDEVLGAAGRVIPDPQ